MFSSATLLAAVIKDASLASLQALCENVHLREPSGHRLFAGKTVLSTFVSSRFTAVTLPQRMGLGKPPQLPHHPPTLLGQRGGWAQAVLSQQGSTTSSKTYTLIFTRTRRTRRFKKVLTKLLP